MKPKTVKPLITNICESDEIIEPKYFSQFILSNNIFLPCNDLKNTKVEIANANLEVHSIKIIKTISGTSIEGQNLTGKKLIILGKVNLKILIKYFNYRDCKYKLCYLKRYLPFSTFIIIPNHICMDDEINLKYVIEDISAAFISKKILFISIPILIQYDEEYL